MKKHIYKQVILCSLLLLSCIIGLLIINLCDPSSDGDDGKYPPPHGFSPYFVNAIVENDEYQSADIEKRMNLFNRYLLDISEDGFNSESVGLGKNICNLVIDPDLIYVDHDNKTITYLEQTSGNTFGDDQSQWFRYDFVNETLIRADVSGEIDYLVNSREFQEKTINEQMNVFYEKLLSMTSDNPERLSPPYVTQDSIEVDNVNKVIRFRCGEEEWVKSYYFIDGTLEYFVNTEAFMSAKVETQMDMFYQKLQALADCYDDGSLVPYIDPDSIMLDEENLIIYYRCLNERTLKHYSFTDHSF